MIAEATVSAGSVPADAQSTASSSQSTPVVQPTLTPALVSFNECLDPPRPPEYINYEAGMLLAIEAATGAKAKLGVSTVQVLRAHALPIRNTYHLATAGVGEFNNDTVGYFEWLTDFVRNYMTGADSAGQFVDLDNHLRSQFIVTIDDPTSAIGSFMRCLESRSNDIDSRSGPYVYWDYLYGTIVWSYGNSIIKNLAIGSFESAVIDYEVLALSETTLPDFATFLGQRDFAKLVGIAPATESADPTPTPTHETTAGNEGVPGEGSILYDRPLSEWSDTQEGNGWTEAINLSFHIGVFANDLEEVVESWTDQKDFEDVSASVEVREISDRANAVGCISLRHDVAVGDYSLCMFGDGKSWAAYNYVDDSGRWQVETLLWPEIRSGMNPSPQSNTLKIVARGSQLWFIANDIILGTFIHSARSIGAVALSVTNWDGDIDAEFAFENLIVHSLD